ncbi:MAG: hypothetical protein H0V50_03430 [Thermoleophilaceae bacterium]|nr:hypothetical protein [Thermoleophilaceae bacterium]
MGLAGSLAAGIVSLLLFDSEGAGIMLSILGATAVMYFVRRSRGGGLLDPGGSPDRRPRR